MADSYSSGGSGFGGAEQSEFRLDRFIRFGLMPLVFLWGIGWCLLGIKRIKNFIGKKKYRVIMAICPNEECKQRLRFSTTDGANIKVVCPKCGAEFIDIG